MSLGLGITRMGRDAPLIRADRGGALMRFKVMEPHLGAKRSHCGRRNRAQSTIRAGVHALVAKLKMQ